MRLGAWSHAVADCSAALQFVGNDTDGTTSTEVIKVNVVALVTRAVAFTCLMKMDEAALDLRDAQKRSTAAGLDEKRIVVMCKQLEYLTSLRQLKLEADAPSTGGAERSSLYEAILQQHADFVACRVSLAASLAEASRWDHCLHQCELAEKTLVEAKPASASTTLSAVLSPPWLVPTRDTPPWKLLTSRCAALRAAAALASSAGRSKETALRHLQHAIQVTTDVGP
jgi:hypothetical protein